MMTGEGTPAPTRVEQVLNLPFDSVEDLTDGFAAVLFSKLDPGDVGGQLLLLRRAIDVLELKVAERTPDIAPVTGSEGEDVHETRIGWLRHEGKLQFGVALDRVTVGEQVLRLQKSAQALRRGDIGFAHLVVMSRMLSRLTTSNACDEIDFGALDEQLLQMAKASTPGRFWHLTQRLLHALDPDLVAQDQRLRAEERWLRLSDLEDGSVAVTGRLDSIGGAAVRSALEPLSQRMGEGDDRCHERRLADGWVEMGMMALDSGRLPHAASQRPHLQVTTTLETLYGKPGAPAAEMEFAAPISGKTVQRIACDAAISRVIFGPGSVVIDAGRERRVVSGGARRALEARDRHCRWPGCERPARWSAAHHLVHWVEGGLTDLNNLILLCHRHHWAVHEGGWKLARAADDRLLAIPPTHSYLDQPRAPAVA